MKIVMIITCLFFIAVNTLSGQHLIGFDKQQVKDKVRAEMKGFHLDNSSVNPTFNYLKFIHTAGTKTLLVFFDEEDISINLRIVYDYSEYHLLKAGYNAKYKSAGKSTWEYSVNDEDYIITLEEKEYYFVVYIEKKSRSDREK